MWPFRRPKSQAHKVIEIKEAAIAFSAEKWTYFCQVLKFKSEVPLRDQIQAFLVPLEEGLKNNFPVLRDSPSAITLLFAMKGIEKSGLHSRQEIEDALGIEIPD